MATDIQIDWTPYIQEWKQLGHGEAGPWFTQLRNKLFPEKTVSAVKAKFHRERRPVTGKVKESPKQTDERKIELCKIIIEMKERGKKRADTERELSTKRCIDRMVRRGIMKEGELSAAHANTIMREKLQYREETPRVRWEVDRALAEVQTDGSVSKYFRPLRLSEDGKDVLLKASGRPLRYKGRDDGHKKLILWQFQDKYSRLRTVRGIPGRAESTSIVLAHMKFWLNRPQDEHPMRHIPWSFAHDNGAPFRTQEWRHMMRALGLNPDDIDDDRSSIPYEKTGIGSVERSWQSIWQFEMELSEDYDQIWLSQYNMRLHEAMAAEQKMEHPYYSGYRGDLYQQSLLKQDPRPRVLNQDVLRLAMTRYEKKVSTELNISIDGTKYKVPQYYAGHPTVGKWMVAWKNWRGELVAELRDHHCTEPFELSPFEHQLKGEYNSHKRTYRQRVNDQVKAGEGIYEAIMAGQVTISDDGEYINEETGEVMSDTGTPQRLQPAEQEHAPDSPFAASEPDEAAPERFESLFKARVWIGKQLPHGYDYGDVAGYFDPKLEDEYELQKQAIAEAVRDLVEEINAKQKTG